MFRTAFKLTKHFFIKMFSSYYCILFIFNLIESGWIYNGTLKRLPFCSYINVNVEVIFESTFQYIVAIIYTTINANFTAYF